MPTDQPADKTLTKSGMLGSGWGSGAGEGVGGAATTLPFKAVLEGTLGGGGRVPYANKPRNLVQAALRRVCVWGGRVPYAARKAGTHPPT